MLQYSLNAKVNSAVFVGPGGDTPKPRVDSALFKVSVDAPDATPIAATAPPAGALSADGKWRAQVRELPRAPAAEVTGTEFEKRHASRFKGRSFDWMRFQSDGQDYPTPDPRLRPAAEIAISDVEGGQPKTITSAGMRAANVAWHPNGTTIAFTADDGWKNEQAYEQPDIYTTTTSGEVKRLTNDGYVWSSLSYSPDGQFLLSERTFGTGMIIEKKLSHGGSDDLIVWPTGLGAEASAKAAGTPLNLTASWDLEPNAPRWSPDSKFVYFTADKGGTVHLFRVAARAGAPIEQITKGDRRLNSITFDKAMTRIAYTVGTYESPSDVWTANLDGTGEKRLTDLFADIRAEIGITKTERITWKSNDGTEIEGWLTQPYGYDPKSGGEGTVRIRSSSSITAARTPPSATDSISSSSTSRRTDTSFSIPTSAARPATAMRSSGRRGARGARKTGRTWSPASIT